MPRSEPRPGGSFGRQVLALLAKDLVLEWRSREIVYTMLLFSALVVLIFAFAFAGAGPSTPMHGVAGGILWVVLLFAGTLGLGRLFGRELDGDTRVALLLCPASRAAIYLSKVLGLAILIAPVQALVVGLLLLIFDLSVASIPLLLALLSLGTAGFCVVGCLFAATLLQGRGREVLLGILLYPIVTPLVIAGAKGTAALLGAEPDPAAALVWIRLMAGFDVVFLVLSLWTFNPLSRQE